MAANDVSLRQLRYFAVLGRELNYRRAAEILFVTQPAISLAIKQLEAELGVKLLIRDTQSVALSDAGKMWLPKVNAALSSVDQLSREITEWARGVEGVLRIGYLVGIGTALLTKILPAFEESYPNVEVEAIEYDFSDPTAGLSAGAVDLAIVRPPIDLPNHEFLVVEKESWVACLPRNHRFASRESLSINELLDEPIIAAPESAGIWRDHWIATDVRGGKPANIAGVASTYELEFTAISRGLGISFTTSGAGANYPRPGIVFVPIVDREPAYVALAWKPSDASSQAMRFLASARQTLSSETTEASFDSV
jgi:DNA-binding transcriptional LysR family regulator